jgi:DNA-binding MarR family transcriptional regulator
MADIFSDRSLDRSAIVVAGILWKYQNAKHGYAYPSVATIAADGCLHRATVFRALEKLRERGWIITGKSHLKSRAYRVTWPTNWHNTERASRRRTPQKSQH